MCERWPGLESLVSLLRKPLPRNISWLHTLGSLLLVYLLFQMLTGILLALYYSPSPDQAHASLMYVREELTFGELVYRLHRWGAGFVLVTAFLHMGRTYFHAAYRKPRELVWGSGLVLGILLTLFAFTGALLPYDQKGYWATVVGINIASSPPVAGEYVRDFLTGGFGDIGPVTLSRFYILHVCVLPLVFAALVSLHLRLLKKAGSAGPLTGPAEPYRPLFPSQAFRNVVASAVGATALLATAALVGFEETGPASRSPGSFVPRPEWYFMGHYELLRILPSGLQLLGTFVIPNGLLVLLLLLPFLDRGADRSFGRRRLQIILGVLAILGLAALTVKGIASVPEVTAEPAASGERPADPVAWGRELFTARECRTCHVIGDEGGTTGPDLSFVGRRLQPDWLPAWIRNPKAYKPTTEMPAFEGSEEELKALVAYLLTLK